MVPGLLQPEQYIRRLYALSDPLPANEIDQLVHPRLQRQGRLTGLDALALSAVSGHRAVRDSKDPTGPALAVHRDRVGHVHASAGRRARHRHRPGSGQPSRSGYRSQLLLQRCRPSALSRATPGASYAGSFVASTSTFSILGGAENRSGACAIRASATRPDRCASRPESSRKTSKIP